MDMKLLASTFAVVFLAELGDKTQLATLVLAADGGSRLSVFLGSTLALTSAAALAVLAGGLIGDLVSPVWMKRIAGGTFIIMGTALLLSRPDSAGGPGTDAVESAHSEDQGDRPR